MDDGGTRSCGAGEKPEELLRDLRFSLTMALSGVGDVHPSRGRRSPYRPPLDFSDVVVPRLIEHLLSRGWQFRHRHWPAGEMIGKPDGPIPTGPSTP
jgi:hypothetical protein